MRLLLVLCCLLLPAAWSPAATRLATHVTQEERVIWGQRAVSGPYRIAGDVKTNSPGDWTRLLNSFNTLSASDAWNGSDLTTTPDGCIANNSPAATGSNPGLGRHTMNTAFVIMVQPTMAAAASKAAQVRSNLMTSATAPMLNFGNSALWCPAPLGDQPAFQIAPWQTRLLFAYEYLKIYDTVSGGAAILSAGDKTTIDAWIAGSAPFWRNMAKKREDITFVNAPGGNFTLHGGPATWCTQTTSDPAPILWHGGPTATELHEGFNNRWTGYVVAATMLAIHANNTSVLTDTKRYVKEWMQYGVHEDGTPYEFSRAEPANGFPNLGWWYAGATVHMHVMVADALARFGDFELYDYSTTLTAQKGTGSTCTFTNNTTKTLQSIVTRYFEYADHTIFRYSDGFNGNSNYLIDSDNAIGSQENRPQYIWFASANLRWNSPYLKNMYLLNGTGAYTPSYVSGDWVTSSQSYWGGSSNYMPAVMFQSANLEGVVNPYSTAGTPPTCTITAPEATFPIYDTTATAVVVSGTAVDAGSVTSTAVSCSPSCGTPSNTGTATAWSFTVPVAVGTTTVTVTATDNDAQTGQCSMSIRRQSAADATSNLRMHLPLDEGTGTTPQDATANNHDGVFGGTPTWVAGNLGPGAVLFDSSADMITVSGLLTSPAALTLKARFKFAAVPAASGDLISLGDAVALRVSSTTINGFFYNGTSWITLPIAWTGDTAWHSVSFAAKNGEQTLYLDNVLIGYGVNATTPTYTGSVGTNTLIGAHGNGSAGFAFPGTIDNPKVWTRYLSRVDLVAEDSAPTPQPPSITLTMPTSAATYDTSVSPVTTFAGTASDPDGTVSTVTWVCTPGCGSGTATGTTEWTIASVPVPLGESTLVVTATDNTNQTNQDSVFITYVPPPVLTAVPAFLFTPYYAY